MMKKANKNNKNKDNGKQEKKKLQRQSIIDYR